MVSRIEGAGTAHASVMAALHAPSIAPPWSSDTFATLLGQPGIVGWIALDDEAPVGFLLARAAADEAEILTLAVLPDSRRRGIGRHLVRQLADWAVATKLARLHLEVAVSNVAARALYEGIGFTLVGRRKNYYGPGDDALLLALTPG